LLLFFPRYTCDNASRTVDIFSSSGGFQQTTGLSAPRGWPAACPVGDSAVFAGGGRVQDDSHSPVGDVVTSNGSVRSNSNALYIGRWGIACATVGSKVYMAGGRISGTAKKTTASVDVFDSDTQQWSVAPMKLSVARESMGAAVADGRMYFAGGVAVGVPQQGFQKVVDVFSPGAATPTTASMKSESYWPGMAVVNSTVYLVGNSDLTIFNGGKLVQVRSARFSAKVPYLTGMILVDAGGGTAEGAGGQTEHGWRRRRAGGARRGQRRGGGGACLLL
jgi:hypothetical protein